MGKSRDRNLLFAVLAVQLRSVAPEKVMEVAGAWAVNPTDPLSVRLQAAGLVTPEDVILLEQLVDQMVAACGGDVDQALATVRGGQDIARSIAPGTPDRPIDATRPMDDKFPFDLDAEELSVINETEGRYSQISEHGRGGMGRVLLVHDQFLGREIALKELLLPHGHADTRDPMGGQSPMRDTTARLARFVQEARITGQLEHPGIVPVYELGRRSDGTFYYTMRLVRGKTLDDAFKQATGLEGRLRLLPHLLDLCQALAYAHTRAVIHRDIKPANVMIGEFGETVLLDWGLAKIRGKEDVYAEKLSRSLQLLKLEVQGHTPQTELGEAVGTPHYMPPEQARGLIDELDERSDVYSVGAVLYEMLTGHPPFTGRTPEAVLFQVIEKEPKRIDLLVNGAPPELISICKKAMAKDPDLRYQSMKALRDELLRFQTGAFVQAYKYSPGQVMSRYYQKHRVLINTAAIATIVLLAMGVYSYVNILRSHQVAQRQQYLAQLRLAQNYIDDQKLLLARQTLDTAPEAERDWAWAYARNQATPALVDIRSETSAIVGAFFTPDGRHIISVQAAEPPAVWDAHTGALTLALETEPTTYNNAAVSPDGIYFAAIGANGRLDVWEIHSGRRIATSSHPVMGYSVAFAPDSSTVFSGYEDGRIIARETVTGKEIVSLDTGASAVGGLVCPTETIVLASSGSGKIICWDTAANNANWEIDGGHVWAIPGQKQFLSEHGPFIALHELVSGAELLRYPASGGGSSGLSFSGAGRSFLLASLERQIHHYSLDSPEPLMSYPLEDSAIAAYFSSDDSLVIGCTVTNEVYVWDAKTAILLNRFSAEHSSYSFSDYLTASDRLLVGSSLRTLQTFDPLHATGLRVVKQATLKASELLDVAISRELDYAANVWSGQEVQVHRVADLEVQATFPLQHVNAEAAFTHDGHLLYQDTPSTIAVADVESATNVLVFNAHDAPIHAFTPDVDDGIAASADANATLRLWDITTGQTRNTIELESPAHALALSSHDAMLAAGGEDGTLRIYNPESGELQHSVNAHQSPVLAMAYNHHCLATLAKDGTLAIWNPKTGGNLATYPTEEGSMPTDAARLDLRFDAEGRYLFTRMHENLSLVVDTLDYEVVIRKPGGTEFVLSGPNLLSIRRDGVMALYSLD